MIFPVRIQRRELRRENTKIEKCRNFKENIVLKRSISELYMYVNKKYFNFYDLIEKIIYRFKSNDYCFGFSNAAF